MTSHEYFLEKFAKIYPFSHCIWRIPEAVAQTQFLPFRGPCLDLGCGDGTYMQVMLGQVGRPTDLTTGSTAKLIGLDPQAVEIERARARGIYDELIVGVSTKIPLPDASVSMVFSNSVVEHIEDKQGTIREIARILKPGGRYVFSAPSEGFTPGLPWRQRLERWRMGTGDAWASLLNGTFKHYWMQSPEAWTQDLAQAGLRVVGHRYTLTPENHATWERFLIPSYLQHIPAKRFGWVPGAGLSKAALRRRMVALEEPADLSSGGNIVMCAEKPLS
ncbi:MAG: class I SAM-dependent methyltransferase [Patescibacteria group bacterium]